MGLLLKGPWRSFPAFDFPGWPGRRTSGLKRSMHGRMGHAALMQEQGVPVLELYTAFQQQEGWQRGLLDGGLHLTERGNRTVFRLLQDLINSEFPNLL